MNTKVHLFFFFFLLTPNINYRPENEHDNYRTLKPLGVFIIDTVCGCQTGVEEMAMTGKNIKITLKIVPQLSCSFFSFTDKEWSQKVIPVYHNN